MESLVHQVEAMAIDARDLDSSLIQPTVELITSVTEISDHNTSCVRLELTLIQVLWDVCEELAKLS